MPHAVLSLHVVALSDSSECCRANTRERYGLIWPVHWSSLCQAEVTCPHSEVAFPPVSVLVVPKHASRRLGPGPCCTHGRPCSRSTTIHTTIISHFQSHLRLNFDHQNRALTGGSVRTKPSRVPRLRCPRGANRNHCRTEDRVACLPWSVEERQ